MNTALLLKASLGASVSYPVSILGCYIARDQLIPIAKTTTHKPIQLAKEEEIVLETTPQPTKPSISSFTKELIKNTHWYNNNAHLFANGFARKTNAKLKETSEHKGLITSFNLLSSSLEDILKFSYSDITLEIELATASIFVSLSTLSAQNEVGAMLDIQSGCDDNKRNLCYTGNVDGVELKQLFVKKMFGGGGFYITVSGLKSTVSDDNRHESHTPSDNALKLKLLISNSEQKQEHDISKQKINFFPLKKTPQQHKFRHIENSEFIAPDNITPKKIGMDMQEFRSTATQTKNPQKPSFSQHDFKLFTIKKAEWQAAILQPKLGNVYSINFEEKHAFSFLEVGTFIPFEGQHKVFIELENIFKSSIGFSTPVYKINLSDTLSHAGQFTQYGKSVWKTSITGYIECFIFVALNESGDLDVSVSYVLKNLLASWAFDHEICSNGRYYKFENVGEPHKFQFVLNESKLTEKCTDDNMQSPTLTMNLQNIEIFRLWSDSTQYTQKDIDDLLTKPKIYSHRTEDNQQKGIYYFNFNADNESKAPGHSDGKGDLKNTEKSTWYSTSSYSFVKTIDYKQDPFLSFTLPTQINKDSLDKICFIVSGSPYNGNNILIDAFNTRQITQDIYYTDPLDTTATSLNQKWDNKTQKFNKQQNFVGTAYGAPSRLYVCQQYSEIQTKTKNNAYENVFFAAHIYPTKDTQKKPQLKKILEKPTNNLKDSLYDAGIRSSTAAGAYSLNMYMEERDFFFQPRLQLRTTVYYQTTNVNYVDVAIGSEGSVGFDVQEVRFIHKKTT